MIKEYPLVSIIVITYNSAKYVLETLESVKVQTYQNIELIVSDDCSTDNTVDICRLWIEENKARFIRTEIITVRKNTGIPSNCNRGVKASNGEWVKLIAGDDVLLPNYLNIILNQSKGYSILCSNYYIAQDDLSNIERSTEIHKNPFFKCLLANCQFQFALRNSGTIPPLTAIFKRVVFDSVRGFNEKYPLIEDYPFFLEVNRLGFYVYCLKDILAIYRRHGSSLTSKGNYIVHPIFISTFKIQKDICSKYVPLIEKFNIIYYYYSVKLLFYLNLNQNTSLGILFWKTLKLFNFFSIYRKFIKLFRFKYSFENYLINRT